MRESLRRLASEDSMPARARGLWGVRRRVVVHLLDDSQLELELDRKSRGADLLDRVCESLDLMEKDYFGLLYDDRGDDRAWLDLKKRLSKTYRNAGWEARLAVKFYPPEPAQLLEDATRYQLALAVRRDLLEGRLSCSSITHVLLASYTLQAELGDLEPTLEPDFLSAHRLAPPSVVDEHFHAKIIDLYKNHKGMTPAQCELMYLENAKKLWLYGTEAHAAQDSSGAALVMAVCARGVLVCRDGLLLNRFPWAKIIKVSFNKRTFMLSLRAGEFDEFQTVLSFRLPSTRACKKLWKSSVEQHMFFRREAPVCVARVPGWHLGTRQLSCRRTLRQLRAGTD